MSNIPEHLKDNPYYQNNPVPSSFQEIKPEFRVRDLATGKWLNKYSGGKSWYRKSAALNALQDRQKRHSNEPGRFVLEEYIVGIQVVSSGEDEIRERNAQRERQRMYEAFKSAGVKNIDNIVRQDYNSSIDMLLNLPEGTLGNGVREKIKFYNKERAYFRNLTFQDYMDNHHHTTKIL